ncbi:hypothetical protein Aperf_G00000133062 [Anoplocephala perfoliata]
MISALGRNYPHILSSILNHLDDYTKATLYEASGTLGIVEDNRMEYKMRQALKYLTCLDDYLYHYLESGPEKSPKSVLCDAYRHYLKTFRAPVIGKNPYSSRLLKILILGDDSVPLFHRKTILENVFTPGKSRLKKIEFNDESVVYSGISDAMDSELQAACNDKLFISPSENLEASMKANLTDYEYVLFLSMCQPESNVANYNLWDLCDYLSKTDNLRQTRLFLLTLSFNLDNPETTLACLKWSFKSLHRVAVAKHNKIPHKCSTQGPSEICSKFSEELEKISSGLRVFNIKLLSSFSAVYVDGMNLVMTHIFGDFFKKIG